MILEEQTYRPQIYPTDSRAPKIVDNWGGLHRENKDWRNVPVEKPDRKSVV